jgi:hypothetical protein
VNGLPDSMAAIEIAREGGPKVLVPRNVARPPERLPIPDQSGGGRSQRPDVQQREGHYPTPKATPQLCDVKAKN